MLNSGRSHRKNFSCIQQLNKQAPPGKLERIYTNLNNDATEIHLVTTKKDARIKLLNMGATLSIIIVTKTLPGYKYIKWRIPIAVLKRDKINLLSVHCKLKSM